MARNHKLLYQRAVVSSLSARQNQLYLVSHQHQVYITAARIVPYFKQRIDYNAPFKQPSFIGTARGLHKLFNRN